MEKYNLTQTGQEVQDILDNATPQSDLASEVERAQEAERLLGEGIQQNTDDIDAIEGKIPSAATSENKLTDKEYVDGLVDDEKNRAQDAEQQNADDIDAIEAIIPSNASSENKLATSNDVDTVAQSVGTEETRAKAAEKQNADDIDAIESIIPLDATSENKLATVSDITTEATTRENADAALQSAIEAILLLIPSAASSLNQLADKAFVNSSIATNTATFRGTFNLVNDLHLTLAATHAQVGNALALEILDSDNNDYCFVQIPTVETAPNEIAQTDRYKFNGSTWEYEYTLNNSGFTSAQWIAINSGITSVLVSKLSELPTNSELTSELGALTTAINNINLKIPAAAAQNNKLVDTAALESYIVQVLDVLTVSYNITSTDGHVTLAIQQTDGKITSVSLTTSDIASAAALNLKASQADLTALASRVTTAEGNITTLSGRVSTNETDIAQLQAAYEALTQSDIIIGALPASGVANKIYRVPGTNSYSDYMWNGSTWVLMATYNNAVDPRPKKASQNLVTSGGIFDNMGALDISELNATENPHTLATYADLSAALAAIPSNDYKKGGMSIKFVQSSDNKYVQARFMLSGSFTSAQFTNKANWQVVEKTLTFDSKNLIESGAVAQLILKQPSIDLPVDFGGEWDRKVENMTLYAGVKYKITATSTDVVDSANSIRLCGSYSSGTDIIKQFNFPANVTSASTTVTISETKTTYCLFFLGSSREGTISIEQVSNISTDNIKDEAVTEEKLSAQIQVKINPTIDNEPTYNSSHLVKSGGVEQMLLNHSSIDFDVTLGDSGWKRVVDPLRLIAGIKYRIFISAQTSNGDTYVRLCSTSSSGDVLKQVTLGSSSTEATIDYLADETRPYCSIYTTGEERSATISIFKIENVGADNIKDEAVKRKHLSQEVINMITTDNSVSLSLINRPQKMVVASNDEKVTNRSQFTMTTIKSFVPALDYKGKLVFENPSNPYDDSSKILFEEHIIHANRNYEGDWVFFVSDNDKNFTTYVQRPKRSIFGYTTPVASIGGDSDGLLLGFTTVTVNSVTKDLLLRSLDGGRSFEPAINTYRAKITINASELTDGTSVVIDGDTYTVITVSAAQTYLSTLTETTSEARRSAARTYLEDKILLSANTQDVLRTLACALIESGYKVRLKADSIDVYYKEIGDAGNNSQTISVGGTSKTFNGGVSMTDDAIIAACLLEMGATGKTYIDDSTIQSKDLQEVCSMFNIDGSWHLIGYCCKNDYYDFTPTPLANIDLVIDDVDNLRTSTYTYNVIYNTIMNSSDYNTQPLCEPTGSYNYSYGSNGIILVGFRQQGGDRAYYCYSLDKGTTWSDIKALPGNATVNSNNLFVALVRNPLLDNAHYSYFYDRNNINISRNIFIAFLAERKYSVVYAATAEMTNNLDELNWSNFTPLNHFAEPDILNHSGIGSSMNIYLGDINGGSSSPAMCYAPIHKGVAILYSGFQEFDGSKNCFKSLLAIEDC